MSKSPDFNIEYGIDDLETQREFNRVLGESAEVVRQKLFTATGRDCLHVFTRPCTTNILTRTGYVPIHNCVIPVRVISRPGKTGAQTVLDVESFAMTVMPAGDMKSVAQAQAIVARTVSQENIIKSTQATSVYYVSLYTSQPGAEVPVVVIKQPQTRVIKHPTAPVIMFDEKTGESPSMDAFQQEIDHEWEYVDVESLKPSEILHLKEVAGAALLGHIAYSLRRHYFPTGEPLSIDPSPIIEAWGEGAVAYFDDLERNFRER